MKHVINITKIIYDYHSYMLSDMLTHMLTVRVCMRISRFWNSLIPVIKSLAMYLKSAI